MPNWEEIPEDEILNYEGPNTSLIARYERIMNRNLRDSISTLTETFHDQTTTLNASISDFNKTNAKLSYRLLWLNIVLVVLTIILVVFGAIQLFSNCY